ncbi:ribonuclease III [Caulobacter sp. KR2-114]|uniref:ribonuclease III n=1 Tax=Caulobacter sp. KR2-114 TaxID=3400912 RepID=UPI003BFC84E9
MDRRAAEVKALEVRLGHAFADPALLDAALTHASASDGSNKKIRHNERLEFLGDRVLGLLAAEELVRLNPDWREGDLTRRQAALVSGKSCARVARGLALSGALRLAGSTSNQGGRDNDRILGDAMEALMAAVYLDGGLDAARGLFQLAWKDILAEVALAETGKEPKTALQEWAMAQALPLPIYQAVSRTGPDHAPIFTVEVTVQGYAPERAIGSSLRDAEKAAARALLQREGLI